MFNIQQLDHTLTNQWHYDNHTAESTVGGFCISSLMILTNDTQQAASLIQNF